MTRLLAFILLAILVYLLVSALLRRLAAAVRIGEAGRGRRPSAGGKAGGGGAYGPPRGEALVRCAACGVRLPESRALPAAGRGGGIFCSEDCRRRGGPNGGGADDAGKARNAGAAR